MVLEVRGSHHPRGVSTWSLAAGLGGLASWAGRSGLTQGLCLRVWYAPIKRLKTPKAGGVCIFTETFTEYLPCSGSLLGGPEKKAVFLTRRSSGHSRETGQRNPGSGERPSQARSPYLDALVGVKERGGLPSPGRHAPVPQMWEHTVRSGGHAW